MPCQAEESPAVSACPSWEGGGAAHTQGSRVRIRNELWEWADRGGRQRDKKKKSVRKESWKLTAEMEHLMADGAPRQHQPSRAESEGKGSVLLPRLARERKRMGGKVVGRRSLD